MKIYYAGILGLSDDFPKIEILISYYKLKSIPNIKYCNSLFLDSGAFSAYWQKKILDIEKYIKFIKEQSIAPDIYASLDDIGSYKTSMKNYYLMLEAGLSPLPTFHIGEPISILEEYAEHSNYIALGGIAKKEKAIRNYWLDFIFSKYPDNAKIGFHGFGR